MIFSLSLLVVLTPALPTSYDQADHRFSHDGDEVLGKGKRGTSAAFPDHSRSPCYTTVDFPPLFNAINGGVRK
jgi:hypothetical protein